MTIQQILANIKNKTYGEDVRQAIIDGLQLCYTDKALGGYCPVDNLNNYYSGAAFCTSSVANSPFQSSFIVMCAGNSTNCFQVAINATNVNDGYVRNKKNNSWSAWMRLGVSKNIRYWNYDGSELLYTESVSSGGDGIWDGTSTRESTQQYEYTFAGWSTSRNATTADPNATTNITANRDVYAAFTPVLRSYNVYFYNGTSLLDTITVPYGSNATFAGTTPTKDSTAQYDYSFVGWNSHNGESSAEANVLNDIRDNKTVYAAFTSIVRSYNVYFYNGSSLIFTDSVEYGSSATFEGTTPTKASTAQYSYTFSGWNVDSTAETADTDALTNIVADRTVYAVFTSAFRTYTVRFMNGTTVLQMVENVPYGSSAEYIGEDPQHPTAPEEYTFVGFDPTGENIIGDTDCQAVYILNPKELRYWNYNGTELLHTELVEVGGDGRWNGTSSKASTSEHSYAFLGWSTSTNASVADVNATKNITTDRDVYAAFEETVRSYSVYFYNGSTLLYTALVQYGEDASYSGATPTKASTVQYDYHFEGWNSQDEQTIAESGVLNNITADKTVYAAFSSSLVVYHVYFYNGDSLIFTDDVEYGNNASFDGTNPTKDPTAEYEYTFVGWNSQNDQTTAESGVLNNITADKTVYAAYTSALRNRTVYFYNGSTLLGSVIVLRGGNASDSTITTPTKDSTAQYNYTFVGWNSQDEQSVAETGVLDNILEDKNVYAAFSAELRSYDVVFYNGSTLLQTVSVQYGETAVYSGTTPTKATTAQYSYEFSGWNADSSASSADADALTNVTADRTVYAIFTATVRSYTVTFYNGSTLLPPATVQYGGTAIYDGTTPTKASTAQYSYTFSGWNTDSSASSADANALTNVTSDRTVYAMFTATVRSYNVTFYNGSTLLQTVSVQYGGTAAYSGTTPTKASTTEYNYTFVGWNSQNNQTSAEANVLTNITANKTVYAAFSQSARLVVGNRTVGTSIWINEYPNYDSNGYGIGTPTPKEYIYLGKDWYSNTNCILLRRWVPNATTKFDQKANSDLTTDYNTTVNGIKTADSSWLMVFDRKTQNSLVNSRIYYIASTGSSTTDIARKYTTAKCFSLGYYEYGFTLSDPSLSDGTSYLSALKKFYGNTDDDTARKAYVEGTSNAVYVFTRSVQFITNVYVITPNGTSSSAGRGSDFYIRPAISVNPNTPVTISSGKTYLAPT